MVFPNPGQQPSTQQAPEKRSSSLKWFALGLGGLLGVSHLAMIGMLVNNKRMVYPNLNLPVSEFSSYEAQVGPQGYTVRYNSNDPKTLSRVQELNLDKFSERPGGLFGSGQPRTSSEKRTQRTIEEYTMQGTLNMQNEGGLPKLGAASGDLNVACIEAVGGGKAQGRVLGASVGAAAAPAVMGIPIVGPLLGGLVTMFSSDKAANIGGDLAENYSDDC
jgi:hypothetical protein|tara:strand:- start:885 stop:1538 length:654 start_codon:yes stop_codon:yes gene_type:complete